MNKLIKYLGSSHHWSVGIIETACYPCAYYGGYFMHMRNGEPMPADNATGNFHRTIEEAEQHALKCL